MPYIYTYSTNSKINEFISNKLGEQIASICNSPFDWFFFVEVNSKILNNKKTTDEVVIEVKWFDRGDQARKDIATLIETSVKNEFNVGTTVVFYNIEKGTFFEHGNQY